MVGSKLPSVVSVLSLLLGLATGCAPQGQQQGAEDLSGRTIRVVATTSMVADLMRTVGGERLEVTGLMGPGIDPHLYKASEGDVGRMAQADLIAYNGLHLEGKMAELFEQMDARGVPTLAVTDALEASDYLASPNYTGNFDPHIWLDVRRWQAAVRYAAKALGEMDPTHAEDYQARAEAW